MTIILSRSTDSIIVKNESIEQIEIRKSDYIFTNGIIPTIGNIAAAAITGAFYYYQCYKQTDPVVDLSPKSKFNEFTSKLGYGFGIVVKIGLIADYSYNIYSNIKEAKAYIYDSKYQQAIGSIAKVVLSAGGIYVTFTQSSYTSAVVKAEIEIIDQIYDSWSNVYEKINIYDNVMNHIDATGETSFVLDYI